MKTALVTGAGRGMGLAWSKYLLDGGYKVIMTGRDAEALEAVSRGWDYSSDRLIISALEVTDESSIRELALRLGKEIPCIDLLVNNAGVNPKDYPDKEKMAAAFYLDTLNAEEMLKVIHVNSIAPLIMVKHFRALLKKSTHPVVLNISSWLGSVSELGFGGHYGYTGSKNLLNMFNKSMSFELKQDGIICINVNPGWMQTDMGGKKAPLSPEQAVAQIMQEVVKPSSLELSGRFLNADGSIHPW
jgi:NAD(P)-dependent dehydrogenase (short-subunit alcohol dehydrogenase family)